jgi:predicted choloylglycine hydrolase
LKRTVRFLKPKVYAFVGYAPKSISLREADLQFNNFISQRDNGLVLYHDHFVDEPGAIALFYVETQMELDNLETHRLLSGWNSRIHPLTFTEKPVEMLYQSDFTMGVYRGQRLRDLIAKYIGSDYEKSVDEHLKR